MLTSVLAYLSLNTAEQTYELPLLNIKKCPISTPHSYYIYDFLIFYLNSIPPKGLRQLYHSLTKLAPTASKIPLSLPTFWHKGSRREPLAQHSIRHIHAIPTINSCRGGVGTTHYDCAYGVPMPQRVLLPTLGLRRRKWAFLCVVGVSWLGRGSSTSKPLNTGPLSPPPRC